MATSVTEINSRNVTSRTSATTTTTSNAATTVTTVYNNTTFWLLEGGGCTDFVRSGELHVKTPTSSVIPWRKRYVVLRDTWHMYHGSVSLDVYSRRSDALTTGGRHLAIDLARVRSVGEHVGSRKYPYSFYVKTNSGDTTVFGAKTELDVKVWVAAIKTLADKVQLHNTSSATASVVTVSTDNNNCISKPSLPPAARLTESNSFARVDSSRQSPVSNSSPPPISPRRPLTSVSSSRDCDHLQQQQPPQIQTQPKLQTQRNGDSLDALSSNYPWQQQQQSQKQQQPVASMATAAERFQVQGRKLTPPERTSSLDSDAAMHLNELNFQRHHSPTSLMTSSPRSSDKWTSSDAGIGRNGFANVARRLMNKESRQDSGFSESFEDQSRQSSASGSPSCGYTTKIVTSLRMMSLSDDFVSKTRAECDDEAFRRSGSSSGQRVIFTAESSDDVTFTPLSTGLKSSSSTSTPPKVPPRPRAPPLSVTRTTSTDRFQPPQRSIDLEKGGDAVKTKVKVKSVALAAAVAAKTVVGISIDNPPEPPPRPPFTFRR